jgi:predicted nucleic acid-binding protein
MENSTEKLPITLVDTSILIPFVDELRTDSTTVRSRVSALALDNKLVIAYQCLYEFYTVSTRPRSANGMGLSVPNALNKLEELENSFELVHDPENLLFLWKQTLVIYNVSGKPAHDARLVAWMLGNSIKRIYTLNTQDFQRYENQLVLV